MKRNEEKGREVLTTWGKGRDIEIKAEEDEEEGEESCSTYQKKQMKTSMNSALVPNRGSEQRSFPRPT